MLEEQLADDVEATHFALLHRQQAQCEIVASPFPALAEQYPAWVLIPASDCAFHSLTLPAGLRKPPLQVAPFLLEEQLADDVEATHFALLHRQQAQCEIVA
ncbi:hypothetical protein CQA67_32260, partial [Klebsiella pneumoniae]